MVAGLHLQAAMVVGAAEEADKLKLREECQEEALHSASGQLLDLETALTQATASNLDLAQHQRQDHFSHLFVEVYILQEVAADWKAASTTKIQNSLT